MPMIPDEEHPKEIPNLIYRRIIYLDEKTLLKLVRGESFTVQVKTNNEKNEAVELVLRAEADIISVEPEQYRRFEEWKWQPGPITFWKE